MGKNVFRNGSYCKQVLLGKRTVKAGECAALWSLGGKIEEVEGPKRVWMWCTTVRFLDRFSVDQFQYLRIQHRSGIVEHVRGPKTIFLNPVLHESIGVCEAVTLTNGEALVVYSQEAQGVPATAAGGSKGLRGDCSPTVARRIVHGPAVFVPSATEWMHEFPCTVSTHEGSPSHRASSAPKATKAQRFKLSLLQQQRAFRLEGVLTADSAAVAVDLAVYFQIGDVEALLGSSSDPVEDMQNAARTDVIRVAGQHTHEGLQSDAAALLGGMEAYPSLLRWAQGCGASVQVVYKGVSLERASQGEQKSLKFRLEQEEMEQARKARAEMSDRQIQDLRQQAELEHADARHAQVMRHRADESESQIQHLRALHELGVDLTKLLLAQAGAGKEGACAVPAGGLVIQPWHAPEKQQGQAPKK